jgi:hypothetical protein
MRKVVFGLSSLALVASFSTVAAQQQQDELPVWDSGGEARSIAELTPSLPGETTQRRETAPLQPRPIVQPSETPREEVSDQPVD